MDASAQWDQWTPVARAPADAVYTDDSETQKGVGAGVYDSATEDKPKIEPKTKNREAQNQK